MHKHQLSALTATAVAATVVLGVTKDAQAYTFGSSGISFTKNTTVTFTMGSTHSSFLSSLAIYQVPIAQPSVRPRRVVPTKIYDLFWETKNSDNGNANEWIGTFGNTITSATGSSQVQFTFLANKLYALGLFSKKIGLLTNATMVYTTPSLNPGTTGGVQFSGTLADGMTIAFDDGGNNNDQDYNDFTLTAAVPEPLSIAGMAFGAVGMALARKRRSQML